MKLAIMQPYFFPYIGYWQLMAAVDQYIIYDDVNYIKRGWINRNRILVQASSHDIILPLSKASQNKKINEIQLATDGRNRAKVLRTIRESYSKAPYFNEIYSLIEKIMLQDETNLARFLCEQLKIIVEHLEIPTEFIISSELEKNELLKGEEKILAICTQMGADNYINAIGGQALYSREHFAKRGIQLRFLQTSAITYRQFGNDFVPNLSIIDVMMFNPKERIREMLGEYALL